MIVLTKEKRENLVKYYNDIICFYNERLESETLNDFDRGAIESSKLTVEIALASLTAESEIKLPSHELIKEVFLANGFKEKTQPDGRVDLNPYVYDAALALIKSLNSLE